MRVPDPLASKPGRLISFFLLYLTEGIPYGFATTALVAQLTRCEIPEEQVLVFSGVILGPWSLKWIMGPLVDLVGFGRFGQRRAWIMFSQILMCATLAACVPITSSIFSSHDRFKESEAELKQQLANQDLSGEEQAEQLKQHKENYVDGLSWSITAMTIAFIIHNWFAATQDVAIDALAVNVLKPDERGLANGVMFAGAYTGQAVGGSLVLTMMSQLQFIDFFKNAEPFTYMYAFVCVAIFFVTLFVVVPLKEKARQTRDENKTVRTEIKTYLKTAGTSIFTNRNGILAFLLAVLPAGALALNKEFQTVLGVSLGLSDAQLGMMLFPATIISAVGCVAGGLLSDRIGRRTMLVVYILMTTVPTFWLMLEMESIGWVGARKPTPEMIPPIIEVFWIAVTVHALFQGLIYGTKFAVFMDITNPKVAGTQFTAYMALGNVVLSYTAIWQGYMIKNNGYAATLGLDCLLSLGYFFVLPFLVPTNVDHVDHEEEAGENSELAKSGLNEAVHDAEPSEESTSE